MLPNAMHTPHADTEYNAILSLAKRFPGRVWTRSAPAVLEPGDVDIIIDMLQRNGVSVMRAPFSLEEVRNFSLAAADAIEPVFPALFFRSLMVFPGETHIHLDASESCLPEILAELSGAASVAAVFTPGGKLALSAADGACRAVSARGVVEQMCGREIGAFARELDRVLAPGGLFIAAPLRMALAPAVQADPEELLRQAADLEPEVNIYCEPGGSVVRWLSPDQFSHLAREHFGAFDVELCLLEPRPGVNVAFEDRFFIVLRKPDNSVLEAEPRLFRDLFAKHAPAGLLNKLEECGVLRLQGLHSAWCKQVLDLTGAYAEGPAEPPPGLEDIVAEAFAGYGLHLTKEDKRDLADALADIQRVKASDAAMAAEMLDVAERFGGKAPASVREHPAYGFAGKAKLLRHYFHDKLPTNMTIRRTARIVHNDSAAWPKGEIAVAAVLAGLERTSETILETVLPVDLAPGRELSLPLAVRMPPADGRYTLQVWAGPAGGVLSGRCIGTIHVRVGPAPPSPAKLAMHESAMSYHEDHMLGRDMLDRYLHEHAGPGGLVLEIGTGVNPQTTFLPSAHYDVLSVELSRTLCKLGQVFYQCAHPGAYPGHVAFMACDAMQLPFAPGSFDAAAMFSALHHFPEPEKLLAAVRPLLKPKGVLAVMCEPLGHEFHAEMVRELEKGINEQSFSVEEYLWMFRAAGYELFKGRTDGGSFKALLRSRALPA